VAIQCDHPRLVRLDVDDNGLPLYGKIYMCEACEELVEVVTGRAFSPDDVHNLAEAISHGVRRGAEEQEPLDASDLIEVKNTEDSWEEP
jgi:hypothetical protein